jgi:hypothetical protein
MPATRKTKHNKQFKRAVGVSKGDSQETPAKLKRGIKRPSPELAELIRMVNLAPENLVLPQLRPGPWRDVPIESVTLEEEFRDLPLEVQLDLRERYESIRDRATRNQCALSTYEQIRRGRELLYALIDRYRKPSPLIPFSLDDEPVLMLGGGHIQIVSEKSRLGKTIRRAEVHISPFGKAIDGVEVDYIRRCEACSKVFFAGSDNQPCCSQKCAKIRRQKRWRDNRKEGYYQGANLTNKERSSRPDRRSKQ